MKKPSFSFNALALILTVGFLCIGTVFKKKDPIQLTQTDPTSYQEKVKEEAEGKKGAPAPALELFPQSQFLSKTSIGKPKKEKPAEETLPGEVLPEEAWLEEGESTAGAGTEDAWEGLEMLESEKKESSGDSGGQLS